MVCADGTVIDNYDSYVDAIARLCPSRTTHTVENVARFSRSIVGAIDRLHVEYGHERAFLKLDAIGAGGWSCVSPSKNPLLYDWKQDIDVRVAYLIDYINKNILDSALPSHAVIEEFVEAQARPGDIAADYTVCGFVLDSVFYPTSVNLCGVDSHGQYTEQWTAPDARQMDDEPSDWERMFDLYARMVTIEAEPFSYKNGIYAGDLFITRQHEFKQRDWNIRRGGRSAPESLTMLGEPNYEAKATVSVDRQLTGEQLFDVYTRVCDRITRAPYEMHPFSTTYGYFGQTRTPNFLRFDILVDPHRLVDEQGVKVSREKQEERVKAIIEGIATEELSASTCVV